MNEPRFLLRISLLWAAWLSLEHWVLGDLSYLHVHDNADQIIPLYLWLTDDVRRMLGARVLPMLCGVDRFAGSAWVHLFHLPFLVLPAWAANGLVLMFQRAVATYFTARLGREIFRFPLWLAVLMGLVYPLLPAEYGELRLMHGLNEPGLPLLLWFMCSFRLERGVRPFLRAAGLGFFLSLCLDPVSAMPFFLSTAILMALLVRPDFRCPRAWPRLLGLLAVFLLAYLPMLWLPMSQLLHQAGEGHRNDWAGHVGFLPELRHQFVRRLPDWLPWVPACLLGLPFALRPHPRDPLWRALAAWILLALAAGPLLQSLAFVLGEWLGPLRGFNFARYDRLLPLALLFLAAWGLRAMAARLPATRAALPVFATVLFTLAFASSWQLKREHWQGMSREGKTWRSLLGSRDVAALAERTRGGTEPFRVATAGAYHLLHPLYWMPHGFEMADGYMVMYPQRYQHYWSKVVEPLVTTQPELTGHFTRWGSRVYLFHSRLPEDENLPVLPFDAWYHRNLLSLANTRYLISRKPLDAPGMILLPAAADERAIEAWEARGPFGKVLGYVRNENPGRRTFVYENPEALPRAFGVRSVAVFDRAEDCLAAMAAADVGTLRTTAFVERGRVDPSLLPAEGDADARVRWIRHEPNRVELEIQAARDTLIVVSMLGHDRWQAFEADGRRLPVHSVNGPFLGFVARAGTRVIRFEYSSLPTPGVP